MRPPFSDTPWKKIDLSSTESLRKVASRKMAVCFALVEEVIQREMRECRLFEGGGVAFTEGCLSSLMEAGAEGCFSSLIGKRGELEVAWSTEGAVMIGAVA
jgi:pyridoxal biosynthesis lyase PdxS